jgi:hypothetical protein
MHVFVKILILNNHSFKSVTEYVGLVETILTSSWVMFGLDSGWDIYFCFTEVFPRSPSMQIL